MHPVRKIVHTVHRQVRRMLGPRLEPEQDGIEDPAPSRPSPTGSGRSHISGRQATAAPVINPSGPTIYAVKHSWVRKGGWMTWELELKGVTGAEVAALEIDCGLGLGHDGRFLLPIRPGRMAKRPCFLPPGVCRARLDLGRLPGTVRIVHCDLRPLSPGRATAWIRRRVQTAVAFGRIPPDRMTFLNGLPTRPQGLDMCLAWQTAFERTLLLPQSLLGRGADSYRDWIRLVETSEIVRLHTALAGSVPSADSLEGPEFGLVIPVYNTRPDWLEQTVRSVLGQSWPRWRLCLVDDASSDPATRAVLPRLAGLDRRISLELRPVNGGIAAACNHGLHRVAGEILGVVDHDDLLHPQALLWAVEALRHNPALELIYTDEDKITGGGLRHDPHFKPKWSPYLLRGQNYICHLVLMRRALLERVGFLRQGVEGSQDHDLMLRATELLPATRIHHIPWIAYHWRAGPGSTALNPSAKPKAVEAGQRAVQDHLERTGQTGATVESGRWPHTYRIRWPLPDPPPLVTAIVPTRDGGAVLERLIEGLRQGTDYPALEILVVDNQSRSPGTLALFERWRSDPRCRILPHPHPFNFSAIINHAAREARGPVLALINDDIEVLDPGWLREMVSLAMRPGIGCVGAKLLYPNRTVQHGGVVLGIGGVAGHAHKYLPGEHHGYFSRLHLVQEMSAVTGACLVVQARHFQAAGAFDEEHLRVAFNDVDFCLKVGRLGLSNLWTPYAELIHHESLSRGTEDSPEKQKRFRHEVEVMRRRWGPVLDSDPCYSPHLSLVTEDFSIRLP